MQVSLIQTSFSQAIVHHLDFSPTITGYNGEKAFSADMNGDGLLDIVTYNSTTFTVNTLLNTNNGTSFATSSSFSTYILSANESLIDVLDIDGDGKSDIVTIESNFTPGNDRLVVHKSNGSNLGNGFSINSSNSLIPHDTYEFGIMNFDTDSDLDVYAYSASTQTLYFRTYGTGSFIQNDLTLTLNAPNSIVGFCQGKFSASGNNELAVHEEVPAGATSTYYFKIIENNGSQFNISSTFNFDFGGNAYYNGTPNQEFYSGYFTNDNFTDIAIFPSDCCIYMLPNTTGNSITSLLTWQSGLSLPPSSRFIIDVANYLSNPSSFVKDDIFLLQVEAPQSSGALGTAYIDENVDNATTGDAEFLLNTLSTSSHCDGNPITSTPGNWQMLHGDFNNDNQLDVLIYSTLLSEIKVGLMTTITNSPVDLEGYCWPQAANPTETIDFYYSGLGFTDAQIFKYESRDDKVIETYMTTIQIAPSQQTSNTNVVIEGCGWTNPTSFTIPSNWESGYYALRLDNEYCQNFRITFVVRTSGTISSKKVALIANTNTWCAYNNYNNGIMPGSKYNNNTTQRYSFLRPNSITDPFANEPHRVRAELWIYTWLKDNGYDPDIITDLDVHLNTNNLLNDYEFLIMGTHPEYWTGQMYDNVKAFQTQGASGNGGNLVCLGGNAVFEVCDIDLTSNLTNPQFIAYPDALNVPSQQNTLYPLTNFPDVGGNINASPTAGVYDRFDYFMDSYEFTSNPSTAHKRSIDLIGTHYNIINNLPPAVNTTASYTLNSTLVLANHPLFTGLTSNSIIGEHGYSSGGKILPDGSGGASGHECDRYTNDPAKNIPGYGIVPTSPSIVSSVYDGDVQILATGTTNLYTNQYDNIVNPSNPAENGYFPNGLNYSEIIYVPPSCADHRGFVFTAGSITFGGSLVWNYDVATNSYDNDLSRLMNNVLGQLRFQNPNASALVSQFGATISNKTFYIDGVFTVDANITFDNCTLYFTTNSYVQMIGANTLDVNSSTLLASCDYWNGIVANDPQQKLIIQNNSTIKDARTAVYISNNAVAEITNSHFINNESTGIVFANMSNTNYLGFVKGNEFTSNASILPPNTKTKIGIAVNNVTHLNIGDIGCNTSGNDFTNLSTGILVNNTYNTSSSPSSHIGIYNNTFDNIKNTYLTGNYQEAQKISNCYNGINVWTNSNTIPPQAICSDVGPANGAAIFAKNTLPNLNDAWIDVRNTNLASPSLKMQNCDKAIVSIATSVTAKNLYLDNCLMGMMNSITIGKAFEIEMNEIHNTFIGMQFIGNCDDSYVKNNIIECTLYPNGIQVSSASNVGLLWPKGIEVSNYLNSSTKVFDIINGNDITIPHYAGLGISLSEPGSGVAVKDNIINLTSTEANQIVCAGASTILAGILSQNAIGTRIHRNTINAGTAGTYVPADIGGRIDAAGILIDHGQDQAIGCNVITGARFGLMAWSQNNINSGNELLVQGNTVANADAGWVFRHLATEGTLGQVGDAGNDNNNLFPTMPIGGPKVFKFCLGLTPGYEIYTTAIDQLSESKSQNMNTLANDCPYLIQTNPGATLFDISDCGTLQIAPWDGSDIPIDEAIAIATDTKLYVEFPTLAHWYDSKRLYEFLTSNPNLLNDFAQLDSFYNAMTNDAIAQEQATDQQLQNLLQSFDIYTPEQRNAMLEYIENVNNGINNTDVQNENEQNINAIYIKLLREGVDSLNTSDKEFISDLAPQCPYVGGSAVYKARTLNYYLEPGAMYDDMKACNAVGVYKQGNSNTGNNTSLITMENETLAQLKPNRILNLKMEDIMVYPNPTSNYVEVTYTEKQNSIFKLYNALGETILVKKLYHSNLKQRIDLYNISNGLYNYEIQFENKSKAVGKITIVN